MEIREAMDSLGMETEDLAEALGEDLATVNGYLSGEHDFTVSEIGWIFSELDMDIRYEAEPA